MAAPTIAASSSNKSASINDDITVTFATDGPSGIVAGSLLVAHVTIEAGNGVALTTPTGWTLQATVSSGTALLSNIYTRLADGTETSVTFLGTAGIDVARDVMMAKVFRIEGHRLTESVNATSTTAASSADVFVIDGVTTTVDDCLVLYALGSRDNQVVIHTFTWSGATEIEDFGHSIPSPDTDRAGMQSAASETQVVAGSTGTATATASGDTDLTVGLCIAIAPPIIEPSGLTSGSDATDLTSYTTASITPTPNALILCSVLNTKASSANIPTVTGCNLTWVRIRTEPFGSNDSYRLTLFRAMSATPTAGDLTIAFGGVAQSGCTWSVNEFLGVDTGGTNGSRAIRNDRGDTSSGTGTSLTVTLPQIQSPNNVTFGAFGFINDGFVSPGSGYTEISEVQDTLPDRTLHTEFQTGRDRTVDASGPSVAADGIAGIAIEIRATSVITQAALDSGSDATLKTSYTTNSITPSADSLILLAVYNSRSGTATLPTITGCDLTWVLVSSSTFNVNGTQRLSIFRAMSSTPSSGALTIDFGGIGQQACEWSLAEYHNVDTSGSNGENALGVRNASGGGQNTGTSLAVPLNDFASSSNATYGVFGVDAAVTISPGSGLTTIHSITDTTQTQALLTETKLSEDNLVDASWPTSTFAAGFAAEVVQQPESAFSDSTPAASPALNEATGTPSFRVFQVTDNEDADYRVMQVSSNKDSTVDVQVVTEREDADFTVKVVTDQSLAEKFALVVEGEFTSSTVTVVGYRDDYVDVYALP